MFLVKCFNGESFWRLKKKKKKIKENHQKGSPLTFNLEENASVPGMEKILPISFQKSQKRKPQTGPFTIKKKKTTHTDP